MLPPVFAGRRVELWVEARNGVPAINPIMQILLDRLASAEVSVRIPEREIVDPRQIPGGRVPDLVLLKSATTLALSVAVADEMRGVKFLNGARTTLLAYDKAATVARLAAVGLPVPETYLIQPDMNGTAPAKTGGAWVAKPTRGVHGYGVTIHSGLPVTLEVPTAPRQRASYVVDDGTRLVQRRIGDHEDDLKVYVAGEKLFAGRKAFGPDSYADDGISPVTLDPATAEMVRAVGEALDLRLFGVDLRFEGGRPVIIDANPFPGYRGFPAAVPALLSEIERSLLGVSG